MTSSRSSRLPLFKIKIEETGTIRDIKENIARIDGLATCLTGEIIDMGDGVFGLVMEYDADCVLTLVLGNPAKLRMGKTVRGVSEPFRIPVGLDCIGRMMTALGECCDERGPIPSEEKTEVFYASPGLVARRPITESLPTGCRVIDALTPLGKGQRQLILGDRMTGKSSLALDAVLTQRGRDVTCIYCCIGKSVSTIEKLMGLLSEEKALEYTTVFVATDNAPVAEQYILPFSAATLGNYLAARGQDVLVIFDDLTKHAWAYRQVSLLLDRPPGREAYPGDIFYVQTQLMERAGCFNADHGGGSMTFLALAETLQGDLTGYIPSNLASMCDGQIFLSGALYAEGLRPAIDISLSVSIVGGRAQAKILRSLSHSLRADYANYLEILRLSRLSAGLSEDALRTLRKGEAMRAVLQQGHHQRSSLGEIVLLLFAVDRACLNDLTTAEKEAFSRGIYAYARQHAAGLVEELERGGEMTDALAAGLHDIVTRFVALLRTIGPQDGDEAAAVEEAPPA